MERWVLTKTSWESLTKEVPLQYPPKGPLFRERKKEGKPWAFGMILHSASKRRF